MYLTPSRFLATIVDYQIHMVSKFTLQIAAIKSSSQLASLTGCLLFNLIKMYLLHLKSVSR